MISPEEIPEVDDMTEIHFSRFGVNDVPGMNPNFINKDAKKIFCHVTPPEIGDCFYAGFAGTVTSHRPEAPKRRPITSKKSVRTAGLRTQAFLIPTLTLIKYSQTRELRNWGG